MMKKVDHVTLVVNDLEEAMKFYDEKRWVISPICKYGETYKGFVFWWRWGDNRQNFRA